MTENTQVPGAGWHDDPEDPTQLRYWDGAAWTEHRSPKAGVVHGAAAGVGGAAFGGAAFGSTAQGSVAPRTSGAPWWLTAVIAVGTLVIGVVIGVAVGGAGSHESGKPAAIANTKAAEETPASDPAATAKAPSKSSAAAAGDEGSASNPFPITTPWTYDASYFGEDATQWAGTFEGVATLALDTYNDDQSARCYAIVGTMSPTAIAGGALTNNVLDTPTLSLVVAGAVESDYGFCNTDALEAAGYGSMIDAEVSVGTQYKFYEVVYLPSSVQGAIDVVVLGSPSDSDASFFAPTPVSIG